ncbi:MAG TPA: 23S rRNA (guanosine(2251)-2'-O)-methyltransferase RlmB [Thermomicrobiales bacterium]|nr:23S rRNA (guanosine(2251)-2'-O)-methyltransferase RlmB [Thermomicrobiales bacterium]
MRTPEQGRRGSGKRRPDRGTKRPGGPAGRGPGANRPNRPQQGQRRQGSGREQLTVADPRLLFGRNAVVESLRGRRPPPKRVWIAEGIKRDERVEEIRQLALEAGVPVEEAPRMLLDDMTTHANHQGVVLDPADYPYADIEDLIETGQTILILDHIQDPQNFGSLIRAGDATGIGGVILPQDRSVAVTPAVVNASAGAVEHVPVALVANLNRAAEKLIDSGYWVAGLAGDEESAIDLFEADLPTPLALVVGSEGRGISEAVRSKCQLLLRLPMTGKVASLNAATAGTVALYEVVRQQG